MLSYGPKDSIALIQFTRNHTDHSTDKGYQFEFCCDRCGNGYKSEFSRPRSGPMLRSPCQDRKWIEEGA